jgi:hypothetical protein
MQRLKHWHLFLIFFLPWFISLHAENPVYKGILLQCSLAFIVIHLLITGEYLGRFKDVGGQTFFRINCGYVFVTLIVLANADKLLPVEYPIVSVVFIGYSLLAGIQIIDHVALLIRANESKELDGYKQKSEFMLLFFWPVGIWVLQPRINKIAITSGQSQ